MPHEGTYSSFLFLPCINSMGGCFTSIHRHLIFRRRRLGGQPPHLLHHAEREIYIFHRKTWMLNGWRWNRSFLFSAKYLLVWILLEFFHYFNAKYCPYRRNSRWFSTKYLTASFFFFLLHFWYLEVWLGLTHE